MALPALLSSEDLVKFRTRFCERFLQYGECNFGGKCQYSHNMSWRRRSPQKYIYEPRLCENIIVFVGENGKRQTSINCHNGKNCKFAHSREEIVYHPAVYKTIMCEDAKCSRYYCPFAHSVDELVHTHDGIDYVRQCLGCYSDQKELLTDDSGAESEDDMFTGGMVEAFGSAGAQLRMRKASSASASMMATGNTSNRLFLPAVSNGGNEWGGGGGDGAGSWVTIIPTLKVETVVRAHSPVVPSEMCRAVLSRPDKKVGSAGANIYALAKVIQFEDGHDTCFALLHTELQNIARAEHKNILSIKKVHAGRMPSNGTGVAAVGGVGRGGQGGIVLCIAFEQCSTSLYQGIVDGYRVSADSTVRGLARKMNPHNGSLTATAISRIGDILGGLQRLHFIGITHMRLCPTNILIDNEANFKISDFLGKYKLMCALENGTSPELAGSYMQDSVVVWQPSEVTSFLQGKGDKEKVMGKKVDVWSAGACIFYAMTGQHPYGTFASGDRLAAGGVTNSNGPLFVGGTEQVVENIHNDFMANQHMLYDVPLALDLLFRMLAKEPGARWEVSDLSRHPIFWDFDFIRTFFASLPFDDQIFSSFVSYPLKWSHCITAEERTIPGAATSPYLKEETVLGLCRFLVDIWNSSLSSGRKGSSMPMSQTAGIWMRLLEKFPQVLIRVWDGARLATSADKEKYFGNPKIREAFDRLHLHWMESRGNGTIALSEKFIREYYTCLYAVTTGVVPDLVEDESTKAAASSYAVTNIILPRAVSGGQQRMSALAPSQSLNQSGVQSRAPLVQTNTWSLDNGGNFDNGLPPAVASAASSAWALPVPSPANAQGPPTAAPGMTFVDPIIVKQMAAASAALNAVHDNPDLVAAITGQPVNQKDANNYNQLAAAAAIYQSLLQQQGIDPITPVPQPFAPPAGLENTPASQQQPTTAAAGGTGLSSIW